MVRTIQPGTQILIANITSHKDQQCIPYNDVEAFEYTPRISHCFSPRCEIVTFATTPAMWKISHTSADMQIKYGASRSLAGATFFPQRMKEKVMVQILAHVIDCSSRDMETSAHISSPMFRWKTARLARARSYVIALKVVLHTEEYMWEQYNLQAKWRYLPGRKRSTSSLVTMHMQKELKILPGHARPRKRSCRWRAVQMQSDSRGNISLSNGVKDFDPFNPSKCSLLVSSESFGVRCIYIYIYFNVRFIKFGWD